MVVVDIQYILAASGQIVRDIKICEERSNLIEKIKNSEYDTAPFDKSSLIPPFLNYRPWMEVAPKYQLSSCIIEKIMSVAIDAIFCYLTNATEFTANNRTISTEEIGAR
ncbi:unnamed protein product [Cylicocyclus nassatus]|uniref:Uncharacterized protein n=1 Tax=Cylicocyclus nassatus TaxID=53992 RepID=A0AA36DI69_CYLNA|nr:unnamed protein product [Cylicocyclus nassatus]